MKRNSIEHYSCELSIGILSKNEANRIRACIESAKFADQVILVDSGSTDETVSIAQGARATTYVYTEWLGFDGVVHQRAIFGKPDIVHARFKNPLLHFSRETVHASLKKLTQYSMLGAFKRAKKVERGGVIRGLLSSAWMFFRLYVVKMAFLEGGPGFLYSFLHLARVFLSPSRSAL